MLCVCLMVFNYVYAYTLFVKSIAMVVVFGVFHGIFVLPCVLAVFPTKWTSPFGKKAPPKAAVEMVTA